MLLRRECWMCDGDQICSREMCWWNCSIEMQAGRDRCKVQAAAVVVMVLVVKVADV